MAQKAMLASVQIVNLRNPSNHATQQVKDFRRLSVSSPDMAWLKDVDVELQRISGQTCVTVTFNVNDGTGRHVSHEVQVYEDGTMYQRIHVEPPQS